MTNKKPSPLTAAQLEQGQLPGWSEKYASYLADLPSFSGWNRNRRFVSIRALRRTLNASLAGFTWEQREQVLQDILQLAALKVRASVDS